MSIRLERVREALKHEISEVIRTRLKDPRIGFVTITDVQVSRDLRHANVFFSVYGDAEERRKSMQGLESAASFVRGELGHRLRMRFIPKIVFRLDPGIERGAHVFKLLSQLNKDKQDG